MEPEIIKRAGNEYLRHGEEAISRYLKGGFSAVEEVKKKAALVKIDACSRKGMVGQREG